MLCSSGVGGEKLVMYMLLQEKSKLYFNKKRLIKAFTILGIHDWKKYLKYGYSLDDTIFIVGIFEQNNWKYKRVVIGENEV